MTYAHHAHIMETISILRNSFNGSVEVYTKGSCIQFAMALEYMHPGGTILYNHDHAIYEYNCRCYDVTGMVNKTNHTPLKNLPIYKIAELVNLKYSVK